LRELSGWGRYPRHRTRLLSPRDSAGAVEAHRETGLVARGNGRAYGDAASGQAATISMLALNRMRASDSRTGRLTVEPEVRLFDLLETFVPGGFFPPVVPDTKFVTIGGMIASDVHGKNHHRDGGSGDHVEAMTLLTPGGETVACMPECKAPRVPLTYC